MTSKPADSSAPDALFAGFRDPPAQARPFVRWWWNGDCVTKKEILRELDLMKAAGIGGVEINPIAMPGGSPPVKAKPLTWLSPRWDKMVRAAADGAHQRGMLADLIVGSGWPFGGKFLKSGEMIQAIIDSRVPVAGPAEFDQPISKVQKLPERGYRCEDAAPPRVVYVRLMPADAKDISQTVDLSGSVGDDGRLRFQVPKGKYILHVGTWREGYTAVVHGAPGADGQVLDHLNAEAVRRYLSRMSDSLNPELGGKMGDSLRAMFCDSLELAGANWTGDFAAEFKRRCGYDIEPYLHVLFFDPHKGYPAMPAVSKELADTIRRVRYDYNRTLVDLFHERFIDTFHKWCHENGTLSRYQAYGYPVLAGMLGGYQRVDIPEGDTWLFFYNQTVGTLLDGIRYAVWNKYAASGAHLTGRPLVGCEAMTNTSGVFRATPEYIKQAGDLNFITGVNHTVLHGFNYSPPEAGLPGLVRYGTYFNEHNPWWPYFRLWADYNARLSWVLQASRSAGQVAIMGPTDDIWSDNGLARDRFITTPAYLHEVWQMLQAQGYSCDYVNDRVLEQAKASRGKLCCGPMKYDLLIVAEVDTMTPAAAKAIARFAKSGGKVAFVGQLPGRSPGLKDLPANDRAVQDAIAAALKDGGKGVRKVAPPAEGKLLEWAGSVPAKLGVQPDVKIAPADARLFQIHQRDGKREIFFFSNQHQTGGVDFRATFDTSDRTPWRWDPETGERTPMACGPTRNVLDIHLDPLESLLVVFEPAGKNAPAPEPKPTPDPRRATEIAGTWALTFHPAGGETFTRNKRKLADLATDRDPAVRTFGGTVVYRAEFDLPKAGRRFLDLGEVRGVADVTLNGQPVGVHWWGRTPMDVAAALKPGRNVLEVKVATSLNNFLRSQKDNEVAMRWTRRGKQKPDPTGLIGPVRLLGEKARGAAKKRK